MNPFIGSWRVGAPTVLNLAQRFRSNALLFHQFLQVRGECPELCLALADKRADGVRGSPPALAWNSGDGVTHQLAHKIGHAKQVVFDWQRKVLSSPIGIWSVIV